MYPILKKLLFTLEPEAAHVLAKNVTRFSPTSLMTRATRVRSPALKTALGDVPLENPIGLAAGFDKNGEMVPFLASLGFGFLELGSVTAHPCPGNPRPRIFRLPKDDSLINHMGLPNWGAEIFARRFAKVKSRVPIGINIAKMPEFALPPAGGKDKTPARTSKTAAGIDDYLITFRKLHSLGDYFTFNLSCPNTLDGATFEDPLLFAELVGEIEACRQELKVTQPVLIKLSPDVARPALQKIVEGAIKHGIDGFVLTNTTPLRPTLKSRKAVVDKIGKGGLSGKPLLTPANRQLANVYQIVGREKILIGVGGIMSFEDLLSKLACGASLFQIYTGFIYKGPFFVRQLNQKLAEFCERRGIKNYHDLIGDC